jgi:hypothetical protein
MVWVRTFHTAESLEELQQREWVAGQDDTDAWYEKEQTAEDNSEEMSSHGDEDNS